MLPVRYENNQLRFEVDGPNGACGFLRGNGISENDQDGLERVGSPHGYWHTGIYASGDRLVQADAGMDVAGPG